ncbi:MAG: hypothetical protein KVP17_005154 [Porospora cf. gigantea B]|uniref:uncharacterized protein n=1 Tax=Porospora cf. gigantea B TaxID=2853592 RepID=UPI003571A49A|nr:MAG: hypothetical protein KVP17_005154 [Porospora cf. gigantea B]
MSTSARDAPPNEERRLSVSVDVSNAVSAPAVGCVGPWVARLESVRLDVFEVSVVVSSFMTPGLGPRVARLESVRLDVFEVSVVMTPRV